MWSQQQNDHQFAHLMAPQQNGVSGHPSGHPMEMDVTRRPGRPSSMELVPASSNPRASRNMAEKQRRDNLNTNISTMATLVPTVSGSSRRMDKISILRLAAAYLRTRYTLGRGQPEFLPKRFKDLDLEQYFINNLCGNSGFMIVLTASGKIVYISRHVEQLLGHAQYELLGQSLYNYIHENDRDELTRNLTADENRLSITSADDAESSSSSEDSQGSEKSPFPEQRRNFDIRMAQRTNSRRENVTYEYLHLTGILRLAEACRSQASNHNRQKHREQTGSTSNDIVFVGMAKLLKKRTLTDISIFEADKNEYITRHLVDGRMIFCDHRISVVAGYLSEEVSGKNAFSFMHKEDVRFTMIALREMYDQGTQGTSCYRLITKTGDFIYLQTQGFIEFDKNTHSVESFICVNTLLSQEEGERLSREMKEKYKGSMAAIEGAMKSENEDSNLDDAKSQSSQSNTETEEPSQLEAAITHLILPSPAISEGPQTPSSVVDGGNQSYKAEAFSPGMPVMSGKGISPGKTPEQELPSSSWTPTKNGKRNRSSPNCESNDRRSSYESNSYDRITPIPEKRITELDECQNASSPEGTIVSTSGTAMPVLPNDECEPFLPTTSASDGLKPISKTSKESNVFCFGQTVALSPFAKSYKWKSKSEYSDLQPTERISSVFQGMSGFRSPDPQKRPYTEEDDLGNVCNKRRSKSNHLISEQMNIVDSASYGNGDTNYSKYIQLQPLLMDGTFPNIAVDYQTVDADTLALGESDQLLEFQDLQGEPLLNTSIETTSDLMGIFHDLQNPQMNFEKPLVDAKSHQFPINDCIGRRDVKRAHLLSSNATSCDSDYNNESTLLAQCDGFSQQQLEHKIHQQMMSLQQPPHKMKHNSKQNIGV